MLSTLVTAALFIGGLVLAGDFLSRLLVRVFPA
jgi:hypothetical protein